MRMIFLAGTISILAGAAQAGSIDEVTTGGASPSLEYVACAHCPPLRARATEEQAPTLLPGTQTFEVRKVGGEMKIFRTEAWLGGSPVTFVSKAGADLSPQAIAEIENPKPHIAEPVTIDRSTTSAVAADMDGTPKPAEEKKAVVAFDPAKLELRLK